MFFRAVILSISVLAVTGCSFLDPNKDPIPVVGPHTLAEMGAKVARKGEIYVKSIKGKAVFLQGFLEQPMKSEELELYQGQKQIAKTRTALDGEFVFMGEFPQGELELRHKGSPAHVFKAKAPKTENIKFRSVLDVVQ